MDRRIRLAVLIGDAGFLDGAWRLPDSRVRELTSLAPFKNLATRSEAAGADILFVADVIGLPVRQVATRATNQLEPLTLLSALAAVTSDIGLIGTASTTFSEPYTLARQWLSLDHLSGGRAGWNIVTSATGEQHYGIALPPHEERYRRAREFVAVVRRLWDSWPAGAVTADPVTGRYADPRQLDDSLYEGDYYRIRGPLPSPASPQGRPLLVQAGSSPEGIAFGASVADLIFTMQPDLETARSFATTVRSAATEAGRDPAELLILHGVSPILGTTQAEADARARALHDLIDIPTALIALSRYLPGTDLGRFPLDKPLPASVLTGLPKPERGQTVYRILLRQIAGGRATLRDLLFQIATSRGHWSPVTTPERLADDMASRFVSGAADGFVLMPTDTGRGVDDFFRSVLPLLEERGLYQRASTGSTLRGRLGLPPLATRETVPADTRA